MPQALVKRCLVQFYEPLNSSKGDATGPRVTQFEHTPISPQVSGERIGVRGAPDMKLLRQSPELENCKMGVSGSAGREGSEGRDLGGFCLGTSHRVPLLQRDNRSHVKRSVRTKCTSVDG